MSETGWKVPRTEEGLQEVLRRLEQCRAAGDEVEVGNGLLQLAHLVRWVRSDTQLPPFLRGHELEVQALELFRHAGYKKGIVRSLVAVSSMAAPQAREAMLSEAENLAEELGDDNAQAMVIAARARALGMSNREQAAVLHQRALEIFRRTGNLAGQARSLFSLSISPGQHAQKRDFAIEAAGLYRAIGDPAEASRCITIALMNAEETFPLNELEPLAREGLQDALDAGHRGQEKRFYEKLAAICVSKGDLEEAEKYRRWARELQEADGLTPRERWENDVEMTKTMIAMAKTQGNKEAVKMFQDELKRLKASKPKK